MSLFESCHTDDTESAEPGHWVMLDQAPPDTHHLPLELFNRKLNRSLSKLGCLDYDMKISLSKLRSDLDGDTHDCLHARVAEVIQPELEKAMTDLTDAINRARQLTEEVIRNGC
jgi:hypothetical protein